MRNSQTLLFSALALVGGYVGGSMAPGRHTIEYVNMAPTAPAGALVSSQQVQTTNAILVPDAGLRFQSSDMRTVAFLGYVNGSTAFVLLDGNGVPSVTLTAGTSGKVNVSAQGDSPHIELFAGNGNSVVGMSASRDSSGFFANAVGSKVDMNAGTSGSSLTLGSPGGATGLGLVAERTGGTLTLFGDTKLPALTLEGDGPGGLVSTRDAKGLTTATMGVGKFTVLKDGKSLWQAPPSAPPGK